MLFCQQRSTSRRWLERRSTLPLSCLTRHYLPCGTTPASGPDLRGELVRQFRSTQQASFWQTRNTPTAANSGSLSEKGHFMPERHARFYAGLPSQHPNKYPFSLLGTACPQQFQSGIRVSSINDTLILNYRVCSLSRGGGNDLIRLIHLHHPTDIETGLWNISKWISHEWRALFGRNSRTASNRY